MFCAFCAMPGLFGAAAQSPPPHHAGEGFRNNYPHGPSQSFWLWKWEQLRHGIPQPPPGGWKIPHVKTDAQALKANGTEPTITS